MTDRMNGSRMYIAPLAPTRIIDGHESRSGLLAICRGHPTERWVLMRGCYYVELLLPNKVRFLSKNENVNWLNDCLIINARSVRAQRLHSRSKLALTQSSQD